MPHDDPGREKAIERAMAILSEHFENVQILCSHWDPETNTTYARSDGHGNLSARTGHADMWLRRQRRDYLKAQESYTMPTNTNLQFSFDSVPFAGELPKNPPAPPSKKPKASELTMFRREFNFYASALLCMLGWHWDMPVAFAAFLFLTALALCVCLFLD